MHTSDAPESHVSAPSDRQSIVPPGRGSATADRFPWSRAMFRSVGPLGPALRCMGTAVLLGVIGSSTAAAQSVDYPAMEKLFGEPVTS